MLEAGCTSLRSSWGINSELCTISQLRQATLTTARYPCSSLFSAPLRHVNYAGSISAPHEAQKWAPWAAYFYKKLFIYSYMFKHQSSSKYLWFDAKYLSRLFFHCLKQFLNSLILMPFSASAIFVLFCFTSFISAKCFPLRTLFIQGNEKKSGPGRDLVNGVVWHRGYAVFGQKMLNPQSDVVRCAHNHPSWNGQTCWKSLQNKFTEAKHGLSQHRQVVQWCSWVPRTLT